MHSVGGFVNFKNYRTYSYFKTYAPTEASCSKMFSHAVVFSASYALTLFA